MKRRTLLSAGALGAVALTGTGVAFASTREGGSPKGGEIRDGLTMPSQMLGIDVPYVLHLPEGYDESKEYPVLYLLHGTEGSAEGWLHDGNAVELLDAAIAEERMPPTVTVFADARRDPSKPSNEQDLTYWMNDQDGGFRYHDMFMEEFLPFIANEHKAGGAKENTTIGGLSMGGFGALSFALRNPDRFAAVFAMSSGQRTDEQIVEMDLPAWNWRYAQAWGRDLEGEARLNDALREWNLPDAIARGDDALGSVGYWLDCGEQDQFIQGNEWLRQSFDDKGLEHVYGTRPGAHDWEYWSQAMPDGLTFIGERLK